MKDEMKKVADCIHKLTHERNVAVAVGDLETAVIKRKALAVAKESFRKLEVKAKARMRRKGLSLAEVLNGK